MRTKLVVIFIIGVAFIFSGCIPTTGTIRPTVNIDPRAQTYISFPADNFSAPNYRVTDVSIKSFQGKDWLQISGNYGYEFYGWNISKEEMVSTVYDKIIPDYVRKISSMFGSDIALTGFDITVNTNIITDKQMLFNEQFYEKTGKRVGPFPSPRSVSAIDFYVTKETANQYKNFEIDNMNLRTKMIIIIDNQKRIP